MRYMTRMLGTLVLPLLLGWALPAAANNTENHYIYEALLDTDDDVTTGGLVGVVQKGEAPHAEQGIDYIVRAHVGSNGTQVYGSIPPFPPQPVQVFLREVLRWNGAIFALVDAEGLMYPMGTSNGDALIEFGAPLALLGNPGGSLRGLFHAQRAGVPDNDYTGPFRLDFARRAPAYSSMGLALLIVILLAVGATALRRRTRRAGPGLIAVCVMAASIAWAAPIVLDGSFDDWAGFAPVVTDPVGDSSVDDPAEDILAGYAVAQNGSLFFRMDLDSPPTVDP